MTSLTRKLGFSTGCFYRLSSDLSQKVQWCVGVLPDALELCFLFSDAFLKTKITPELKQLVRGCKHLSLHAPSDDIFYKNDTKTKQVIDALTMWTEELALDAVVFHPDTIGDFALIEKSRFPASMENMDCRKASFKTPDELYQLAQDYDFKFVIDLEHCFENDSNGVIVKEFVDAIGSRLSHCHISGQTSIELHSPIHLATNRKEILRYFRYLPDVPFVNEGTFSEKNKNDFLEQVSQEQKCVEEGLNDLPF